MHKYPTNKHKTQVSSNPHTQNPAKLKKRPKLNSLYPASFCRKNTENYCEIRKTLLINFLKFHPKHKKYNSASKILNTAQEGRQHAGF